MRRRPSYPDLDVDGPIAEDLPGTLRGGYLTSRATATAAGDASGSFDALPIGHRMRVERVALFATGATVAGSIVTFAYYAIPTSTAPVGVLVKVGPFDQGVNSDDVSPPIDLPGGVSLFWHVSTAAGAIVVVNLFGTRYRI